MLFNKFLKILLFVFLVQIVICNGKDKKDDIINIPIDYKFYKVANNIDKLKSKTINKLEMSKLFKFNKFKKYVNIYRYKIIDHNHYIGLLGNVVTYLNLENIGYFIKDIKSKIMAWEVAIFFQNGIIITDIKLLNKFYNKLKNNKYCVVFNELSETLVPICNYDDKNKIYNISYYAYKPNVLFKAEYRITEECLVGYRETIIVKGPEKISWPGPSEMADNYWKMCNEYNSDIKNILNEILINIINNTSLNDNGIFRMKLNAIFLLIRIQMFNENKHIIAKFIDKNKYFIEENVLKSINYLIKN
jgi:hypothetical protein